MNQTNTQQSARRDATSQHSTAGSSQASSFALVLLMPISFVLTLLTIVMLQH